MSTRPPRDSERDFESGPRLAYSARERRARWREASDEALLEGLRTDDELALDELVRRKTQPLVQLAHRMLGDLEEARDVAQMAFLKIWQNRARYDHRYSPNTWIYRITSNLAIDHLRSRKSRERMSEPLKQHVRLMGEAGGDLVELRQREVLDIFHRLAGGLTRKQRAIFVLRELEGLSSAEVAEIVGCRESTVRNHLFNARKYLRRELARCYPEYASGTDEAAPGASES